MAKWSNCAPRKCTTQNHRNFFTWTHQGWWDGLDQ